MRYNNRNKFTEQEIKNKLCHHASVKPHFRELVKAKLRPENHEGEATVYMVSGTPPKGYAVYIPGHYVVNFYDRHGKRFIKAEGIQEVISK